MPTRPTVLNASGTAGRPPLPSLDHAAPARATYDNRRGTSTQRGYGARWRKARLIFLAEHPWCRDCEKVGQQVIATIVDHIEPHLGDAELFWNKANWQPLCKPHHDRKTALETAFQGAHALQPSWLRPSQVPLTIVCGPPASGKTTWVARLARPADVVVDLDQIKAQLSGLPPYHAGDDWLPPAIRARNAMLGSLSQPGSPGQRAWFIVGAPEPERRNLWRTLLAPQRIVVLEVPAGVCQARIEADPARAPARQRLLGAVADWWSRYQRCPTGEELIRDPAHWS